MHYKRSVVCMFAAWLASINAQSVSTETVVVSVSAPTMVVIATTTTQTSTLSDATVTVTPIAPASPQYTSAVNMIDTVLNSSNFFRWEHNASFLAWNDSLATYAANYAQQCVWAHSHGPPGENLARGYPDVISAVDAWGFERDLYDFSTPTGFSEATGHFTQLVWKSTQTVGCSAVDCNGTNGIQGWLLVCEYWPPGNIIGTGREQNAWFEEDVQNQINNGQGFSVARATAGASGVGTSWASLPAAPTATSSSNAVADPEVNSWNRYLGIFGGVVAAVQIFGLV